MKFVHTNLIARDWRRLARFYQEVFGCVVIPPERDFSGAWLDKATNLAGAHIKGVHLRLPGYGDEGPTLEIFQYDTMPDHPEIKPNTPGFAHIAFAADDVAQIVQTVLAQGGSTVGVLTVKQVAGIGLLTFQYVTDPEGNIVEVQNWKKI